MNLNFLSGILFIPFCLVLTSAHSSQAVEVGLPYGLAVALPEGVGSYVKRPNEVVDTEAINIDDLIGKGKIPSEDGDDFFNAKVLINIQQLFKGAAAALEQQGDFLKAGVFSQLAPALGNRVVVRRPVHRFNLGERLGNRVIFYGGENEMENGPAHTHIDRLVHDLDMPLVKVMTHFDEAQGGDISAILENGSAGMSHAGGYYPGMLRGKPIAVRSDWPADYGYLGDENRYYNAHLLAIDYQSGTRKVIPGDVLKEYHRNFALWDVLTGIMIPFVRKEKIEEYADYKNNPLEMVSLSTLQRLASATSTLDKDQVQFTSYCSEGQWNVANLAVNVFISKGRFPAIDSLISRFQGAPGYDGMGDDERRKNPQIGWEWLRVQGVINPDQYQGVLMTRRNGVYLDWVDSQLKPWKVYDPQHPEGLLADPMSLGTMVRTLIRAYYPREVIAGAISEELLTLYNRGDILTQSLLLSLTNGIAPTTENSKTLLYPMAIKLAANEMAFILRQKMKRTLFSKLGYEHIIEEKDRNTVDELYEAYVDALLDPKYATRIALEQRLAELDREHRSLRVKMKVYGPNDTTNRSAEAVVPFFMWAAPQSWGFWAQFPDQFNSRSVRYVVTALHFEQSKAAQDDW